MSKAVPAGGRPHLISFLPLLSLMIGPWLFAQTELPSGGATISVDVDLVVLHATVRNTKGGFASGLGKDNFQVFEDGAPQAIRVFQHGDVPVAVGLIFDNSGSMGPKRKDVTAAALAFVRSSNPQDEMLVVNFNEHVFFGLAGTKLFSASGTELEGALNGVPAHGRTALYDAIEAGLAHLRKAA